MVPARVPEILENPAPRVVDRHTSNPTAAGMAFHSTRICPYWPWTRGASVNVERGIALTGADQLSAPLVECDCRRKTHREPLASPLMESGEVTLSIGVPLVIDGMDPFVV